MWGGACVGVGDMFGSRICFIGFFFLGDKVSFILSHLI